MEMFAYLSQTPSAMDTVIGSMVAIVSKVAGILTTAPLNYFFYASLLVVGVKLFKTLRKSV